MDYPYEDEHSGFSDEQLAEWEAVVDDVNDLFATLGREDEDFWVRDLCPDGISVEAYINNYPLIRPEAVMQIALKVRECLRKRRDYWRVSIWVRETKAGNEDDEACIWLEIDRYRIQPWLGKSDVERFDNMEELYAHYWPR